MMIYDDNMMIYGRPPKTPYQKRSPGPYAQPPLRKLVLLNSGG